MGRELVHNCKQGILQYIYIRPLTTGKIIYFILKNDFLFMFFQSSLKYFLIVIAIICELYGVYGESQFKLTLAYPYLAFVNNLSQFCAMYCLVLFYRANYDTLKAMKPLPKFLCIKAVVFFSFL